MVEKVNGVVSSLEKKSLSRVSMVKGSIGGDLEASLRTMVEVSIYLLLIFYLMFRGTLLRRLWYLCMWSTRRLLSLIEVCLGSERRKKLVMRI